MIDAWKLALLFAAAYLVGSIPFGLLVGRLKNVDVRRHGSGNVGATNVGRVLGKKWGVLVFVLDASKGAAAVMAATRLMNANAPADAIPLATRDLIWMAAGLCGVLGSIFPVYLAFRGGKGVAASIGVILSIYPYLTVPGVVGLLVWVLVLKCFRYVSLASIAAAVSIPISFVVVARVASWPVAQHGPLLGLALLLAVLVVVRHRENIRRLLAGTENKTGRSA